MTEQREQDFQEIYETYFDMVYRVCFSFMKNPADTEDAASEVFLKLMKHRDQLKNDRHIKGWLVVTASNICKNQLRHWWRNKRSYATDVEMSEGLPTPFYVNDTMEAVMSLPDKYKTAIYLYYYEGYNSSEIGKIMGKSASSVRNDLQKARRLLKVELQDGGNSYEGSEHYRSI